MNTLSYTPGRLLRWGQAVWSFVMADAETELAAVDSKLEEGQLVIAHDGTTKMTLFYSVVGGSAAAEWPWTVVTDKGVRLVLQGAFAKGQACLWNSTQEAFQTVQALGATGAETIVISDTI